MCIKLYIELTNLTARKIYIDKILDTELHVQVMCTSSDYVGNHVIEDLLSTDCKSSLIFHDYAYLQPRVKAQHIDGYPDTLDTFEKFYVYKKSMLSRESLTSKDSVKILNEYDFEYEPLRRERPLKHDTKSPPNSILKKIEQIQFQNDATMNAATLKEILKENYEDRLYLKQGETYRTWMFLSYIQGLKNHYRVRFQYQKSTMTYETFKNFGINLPDVDDGYEKWVGEIESNTLDVIVK